MGVTDGPLLLGEPGVGKTARLAAAVSQAEGRGMRVVATAGAEYRTRLSHSGLGQLIEAAAGVPAVDRPGRGRAPDDRPRRRNAVQGPGGSRRVLRPQRTARPRQSAGAPGAAGRAQRLAAGGFRGPSRAITTQPHASPAFLRPRYLLFLAALDGTGDLQVLRRATSGRCGLKHLGPAERARLIRVDEPSGMRFGIH